MARARNLKPGFFKNEDLAECSAWARLCFAGLWTLADREGRLEDRPKRIKGELFAFDSIEVEPLLVELAARGFIQRYRSEDGRGLIQVVAFHKHQNPHHREPESDLPPPKSPGLEADATTSKPEAKDSCQPPPAQGQPEASPGLDPPSVDMARGVSRADSGYSDSGTLIPEQGQKTARKRAPPTTPDRPEAVAEQVWLDWLALRRAKKAPVTATVLADAVAQAAKAGMSLEAFLRVWCSRGSQGLQADWLKPHERPAPPANGHAAEPAWRAEQRERTAQFAGRFAARQAAAPATTTTTEIVDASDPLG